MNGMLENLRVERAIVSEKVKEQSQQVLPFLVDFQRVVVELRDVTLAWCAYEGHARKESHLDTTIAELNNLIGRLKQGILK